MDEKKQYKIYLIMNNGNKKGYIGCTSNLPYRKANHLFQLRNGVHPNSTIQSDYDKYGEDKFQICVELDTVYDTKANAMKVEQGWMDKLNTKKPHGYNVIFDGYVMSKERAEWLDRAQQSRCVKVKRISDDRVYDSMVLAAKDNGYATHAAIWNHCNGQVKNQKFEYVGE